MANPPPLSLVAKALIAAAPSIELSTLAMALSQSMGEGAWSAWLDGADTLYPFEGTNNFGAIHATEGFAKTYANGAALKVPDGSGGSTTIQYGDGWGMVAFLDHAPGPYVTRMSAYPSLLAGAVDFLRLVTAYVNLANVKDTSDYAAQLYVHNYFEGFRPNRTLLANRAAAYQAGTWSDDDLANIAAYASMIDANLASAKRALTAAPSDSGDPSAMEQGRTFAPLGLRLTPSGRVYDHTGQLVAGAPHTVDHARAILGDYHPGAGQISIDDALGSPGGDGVWLFPEGVEVPAESAPAPAPKTLTTRQAEEIGAGAIFAGVAFGAALLAAGIKFRPDLVSGLCGSGASMISQRAMIGGGAAIAALLVGSVAYAASKPAAAAAAGASLVFKAGHRYEIDMVIPAGSTWTVASAPSAAQVQANLTAIASGAFSVVSAGAELAGTAGASSGFTFYAIVDCLKAITVSQSDLLAGAPAGTTITATDEGTGSSGKLYDVADAIPAPLGTSMTVPVGSSIQITNPIDTLWQYPGATTNNVAVVAPSVPATTNGFVAVAVGTAILSGSYQDASGTIQSGTVTITVVTKGAGAISSGSASATLPSSSSSSTSGSTAAGTPAPIATNVSGAPASLASPGPPASTGWATTIVLGPDSVAVTAWPGDAITIQLPNGATWASSGSSSGFPTSGSAPFVGAYSGPIAVTLAWTLGSMSYATTITFSTGRTWGSTSAFLLRYDTVRISLSNSDYAAMYAAMQSNATEAAAIQTAEAALVKAGVNLATMSAAQLLRMVLLAGGPFDTPLAINVGTLKIWVTANPVGTTLPASSSPIEGVALPADWPTDTGGVIRAEFQYTGDGLTLSALPFPLTGWVRLT